MSNEGVSIELYVAGFSSAVEWKVVLRFPVGAPRNSFDPPPLDQRRKWANQRDAQSGVLKYNAVIPQHPRRYAIDEFVVLTPMPCGIGWMLGDIAQPTDWARHLVSARNLRQFSTGGEAHNG
jgi:hypothetical protein